MTKKFKSKQTNYRMKIKIDTAYTNINITWELEVDLKNLNRWLEDIKCNALGRV